MTVTFQGEANKLPNVDETYDCQCTEFTEDGKPDPKCIQCNGIGEQSISLPQYSVNVSQLNAELFLKLLDLYDDGSMVGVVEFHEIPELIRKLTYSINVTENINNAVREDEQIDNFFIKGADQEYIIRKLDEIRQLACRCHFHKSDFLWG